MNKLTKIFGVLLILSLGVTLSSCSKDHDHKASGEKKEQSFFYTCSMHPKVKEKENGKCPICHMNLTKVEVDDDEEGSVAEVQEQPVQKWRCENFPDVIAEQEQVCPIDGTPMVKIPLEKPAMKIVGKVKLRKAQLSHFTPDFFPVTTMKMKKEIRVLGTVLQSEEKESKIPARIDGRVEKVFVKSTGSMIKKGDPVIKFYSPRLITAGEEYLLARKSFNRTNSAEYKELLEQSMERLKLWGIRSFQYESWFKNNKVPRNITIYSIANGIVRKRNAIVGKYFKEGQNFFELSDLSDVWVEMDVYEQDAAIISLGQKVNLEFTSLPGENIKGEVDFVSPVLDPKSRTLKIRTTIQNTSGKIKPGMVADGSLTVEFEGMPLVIPRTAVIDTGKRKVVWVKVNNKKYQAKEIEIGHESEGYVEVKHGLMEGESVVIDGNFLLDAQAQLFGGYEDFNNEEASSAQQVHSP